MMDDTVGAVIVTHDSDDVLPRALTALLASTRPPDDIGVQSLAKHGALLFLNPDAFVTPDFLAGALDRLTRDPTVGALGPKLLGTDSVTLELTGLIDSAGVFWTRYGRPYERGKGEP